MWFLIYDSKECWEISLQWKWEVKNKMVGLLVGENADIFLRVVQDHVSSFQICKIK